MLKKIMGALLFSQAAKSASEVFNFDRVSTVQNSNGNFLVLSMDWGEQNMEINEERTRQNFETHLALQQREKDEICPEQSKEKQKPYSNTM